MRKISFLLAFVISSFVFACLNYSVVGTDVKGNQIENQEHERYVAGLYINEINKEDVEERSLIDLEEYKKTKNLDSYLNYATSLVYLGEYDKAISIFKEIEEKQPNKYELASNLGTAYELAGDNKNALIWIKKALQLNKDSHHGSEWIHIRILEYKLRIIPLENLLGFDFGKERRPTSKYSKEELENFSKDLAYQLSERTQFVKPKEQIVGKLYFDFGNLLALTKDLETAVEAYELSEKYGYNSPLFNERFSHFKELIKENSDSGKIISEDLLEIFKYYTYKHKIIILTIISLISISLILIIIKNKKK